MDFNVSFPGGKRVDVQVRDHLIQTDQPAHFGGQDAEPAPFDLFLASLATCSGIVALAFCQARNLPTEGLKLVQHVEMDDKTHLPSAIRLDLTLPYGFPEKYRAAIARATNNCSVKKAIAAMPTVELVTIVPEEV